MPNISGIVTNGAALEDADKILAKIRTVHALAGVSFIQRELITQTCVITNTLNGILKTTLDQPASDTAENIFLFLEGEIYNTDELESDLNLSKGLSQCGLLLEIFLKWGAKFVTFLNGDFNIVIYQKAEKQLTIFNDHLASKPIYYMEQGNKLFFGSEKKAILAITENSSTVDPLGLLQVFAFYQNLDGKTFVKGMKRLPSASILCYKGGIVTIQRLSPLEFRVPKRIPKINSLIEQWCDHVKQATMRRLKNKSRILINLSGGLDSRALALAISRDLRPFFARTRGLQNSREALYAAEIARRLGFDHYVDNPRSLIFSSILPKVVWRTECAINFVGCLSIADHVQIKNRADFLLGGAYGNVLSGEQITPDMFLRCSRNDFILKTFRRFMRRSSGYLDTFFNKDFLNKFLPALKDSFFRSFEHIAGKTNITLYETWCILESNRQLTLSTASADSHLFEHILPLLDKNHIEFVMTLPAWLRFGGVLYHTMIYHLGPEISDIPYANTNLNLRSTVLGNEINKVFVLGLKSYKKIFGNTSLPSKYKYQRADQEGFAQLIRKDQKFRRIIESFIDSTSFDSSIFNRQGILTLLNKHYRGVTDYTLPLCLFATFAVGIPYFITNRTSHCPPDAEPTLLNSI